MEKKNSATNPAADRANNPNQPENKETTSHAAKNPKKKFTKKPDSISGYEESISGAQGNYNNYGR